MSADDQSWLAGFNRAENRLGVADQLSALPWLGWLPDDLGACPATALDRLATALAISPESAAGLLSAYGGWQGRTRREHRAQVLARLGWRWCAAGERKLLAEFLLAGALELDAPGVLLRLACDWLRAERIVRPPVDALTRRVATARDGARAKAYHRLTPLLQPPRANSCRILGQLIRISIGVRAGQLGRTDAWFSSTWYLTHEYAGRDQTCDLQKLQVAPLTVPLNQAPRQRPSARGLLSADRVRGGSLIYPGYLVVLAPR